MTKLFQYDKKVWDDGDKTDKDWEIVTEIKEVI
jgi:hypothetical protein